MLRLTNLSSLVFLLLVALVAAPAADADEALIDGLKKADKADDIGGALKAITAVDGAWDKLDDKAKDGVVKLLIKMAKNDDLGKARKKAVETLGRIEDDKDAWKALSKVWPDRRADVPTPIDFTVLEVTGKRQPEKAIKPLLDLAEKAKSNGVAARAIQALGAFKGETKQRVKIFHGIVAAARKSELTQITTSTSEWAKERWALVSEASVIAFNSLTNDTVEGWDVWIETYERHKRKLERIMLPDEDAPAADGEKKK